MSVSRTMRVAQQLYESGHITYMRTDSVNLSDDALSAVKAEIESAYGNKYVEIRKYANKNSSAQEAHEAIRPTHFENHTINADDSMRKLYELIWKRTVASQMANAELERTIIDIENENKGTNEPMLTAKQVGRMMTEVGIDVIVRKIQEITIASTKTEKKKKNE